MSDDLKINLPTNLSVPDKVPNQHPTLEGETTRSEKSSLPIRGRVDYSSDVRHAVSGDAQNSLASDHRADGMDRGYCGDEPHTALSSYTDETISSSQNLQQERGDDSRIHNIATAQPKTECVKTVQFTDSQSSAASNVLTADAACPQSSASPTLTAGEQKQPSLRPSPISGVTPPSIKSGHERLMHGGVPINATKLSLIDEKDKSRFWGNVDIVGESECWNWKKSTTYAGYGQFHVQGKGDGAALRSHRVAYFLTRGEIPSDRPFIIHNCDNRKCCNPNHLRAATNDENMADMVSKGRACSGDRNVSRRRPDLLKPQPGSKNPMSKLIESEVEAIRFIWRECGEALGLKKLLGEQFGVSPAAISDIIHGRRWKHLL